MSNYYVANANGDWWKVEDKEDSTLFIISETDLAVAVANEEPEETEIDLGSMDKLERYIRDYGKEIELTAPNQFQEGAKYVLAELATIYSGITETDLWAEFFGGSEE
jgi:predicted DNA-binding transcriptional regulator YafY